MKKKIFVVAAIITSSQLLAQTDSTTKTMDEVVITANKFPQKESSTGKLITAITKEQISQSEGKDLSQLLNEQAGIIVNGATSNPGTYKSLFTLGATSAYTLILLDGVPLNDPTGVGGTFDLRLLPLENIERIEILKGSQSTAYGSNAVAGVINLISKKPETARPEIKALLSYGSFNSFKGSANLSQKGKWLDYDINYVYDRTDGISEAKDTTGNAGYDKDGFVQHGFQTTVTMRLSDKVKVSPYYRFTQFKGGYDADAFIDAPNHYTASLANTGMVGSYSYKSGSIHFTYGYDFTQRDYVSQFGDFFTKGKFNEGEAYADQRLGKIARLVAGLSYQTYHIDMLDTTNSILSPYASVFLKAARGWNIELGARLNHHNEYGNNFTYSFNPSYLVHENVKLFANITSGFRAPSITELFGPFGANPNLKPERSSEQEAGLQCSVLENNLQFMLSGFNRQINEVIIYGNNGYENRDKQHDYGAEAEFMYSLGKNASFRLTYDYVNGRITQVVPGKDTSYYNLVRRPRNNVHLFFSYKMNSHFSMNSSLQITGKRTDTYFSPTIFTSSPVELKGFILWNAYAVYAFAKNKIGLFLDLKNLTNNKSYYEIYGYSVPGFSVIGGVRLQVR